MSIVLNEGGRPGKIQNQAQENGPEEIYLLGGQEFCQERGALNAQAILLSARTGIVDSHRLMLSLLGDFEHLGGLVAWRTEVVALNQGARGTCSLLADNTEVKVSCVINAAGLGAPALLPEHASCFGLQLANAD